MHLHPEFRRPLVPRLKLLYDLPIVILIVDRHRSRTSLFRRRDARGL